MSHKSSKNSNQLLRVVLNKYAKIYGRDWIHTHMQNAIQIIVDEYKERF